MVMLAAAAAAKARPEAANKSDFIGCENGSESLKRQPEREKGEAKAKEQRY